MITHCTVPEPWLNAAGADPRLLCVAMPILQFATVVYVQLRVDIRLGQAICSKVGGGFGRTCEMIHQSLTQYFE